jgi:hypothetical protein
MNTPSTYIAVSRARETAQHRRGAAVCACGAEYRRTADGRRVHRILQGHTPTPAREDGER